MQKALEHAFRIEERIKALETTKSKWYADVVRFSIGILTMSPMLPKPFNKAMDNMYSMAMDLMCKDMTDEEGMEIAETIAAIMEDRNPPARKMH